MALPAALRCKKGRTYAASVWVRADRPGTLVEVILLEVGGGRRYATDSVGAVLESGGWQRVEVAHLAHRPGATLAFEVIVPRGSPHASVLVDELEVTVYRWVLGFTPRLAEAARPCRHAVGDRWLVDET
jgi:hypothetical protein